MSCSSRDGFVLSHSLFCSFPGCRAAMRPQKFLLQRCPPASALRCGHTWSAAGAHAQTFCSGSVSGCKAAALNSFWIHAGGICAYLPLQNVPFLLLMEGQSCSVACPPKICMSGEAGGEKGPCTQGMCWSLVKGVVEPGR